MEAIKRAWNQNKALTIKSLILQVRQWKTNLAQIILPIVCLLCIFVLDKTVARIIAKSLETFTPYEVDVGNKSNIDGYMFQLKTLYSQQQKPTFNASKAFVVLDYEPPEFIYVSRSSNITDSTLGYLDADGSGAGFLGSMFNISGDLRVSINRSWAHPADWNTKRSIRDVGDLDSIRVPYFKSLPTEGDINSVLYDFATNGTQQLSAGALKFRQLNLNPAAPYINYAVLADNRGATKFCESVSLFAGRIACSAFLHGLFATQVHDNALQAMSNGQYGIMGTVAQIPYFAKPDTTFYLGNYLGIFFFPVILSLMLPVFTYAIVLEKENKMREMMKLMGMKMQYYWINTYVFQYLLYCCACIAFIIFASIFQFNIILRTSPAIWVLMLIGWGFMVVSLSILLSAILKSTLLAVVAGYIIVLLGPLASALLVTTEVVKRNSWPWKPILLVYPFPMVQILNAATAKCATDAKCYTPARDLIYDYDILMATIFLFVNGFWYGVVGLYLDKILPQDWGVPAKPWFFLEWIWNNRFVRRRRVHKASNNDEVQVDMEHQETDEEVLKMEKDIDNGVYTPENSGVYIRNLRKEYDDWILAPVMTLFWKLYYKLAYKGEREYKVKAAVKKLSLAIGKNECFGLLGANGAGKSTTMNILSGIIYKTSGEAAINGYDIDTDMEVIRKRFGLCPQFDVLYDDLTVQEHVEFFARIKGVTNVQEHVKYLLEKVQLTKKRKTLSKSLSGGMKRRLSIAISLVGDPSCVVLDEPTTGLDPLTKRTLWDLILAAKKDRCFILTTHSLEEADVLCDRIGIMTRGRLNTIGTSISLKRRYGKGFRISVNFNPEDKDRANGYIQQLIPAAQLHTEFVGNSIFEVSSEAVQVSKLFKQMEIEKSQYGITEWSINLCSLEDVFLTIARKDEVKNDEEFAKDKNAKMKCAIM